MLLAKKYKDNDVVSFKLSSGEEILGRFVREDDTTMYITKPSVLMMNQQGMGMVPFMFTVNPDDEYAINKSGIITHAITDTEIAKQYLSKTSGIALN
jgi:hypothetical protein